MSNWRASLPAAVAVAITAAVTVAVVLPGAQAREPRRCPAKGNVILASKQLNMVSVERPEDDASAYYICTPRRVLLAALEEREGESGVQSVRLVRDRVVYEYLACEDDGTCDGGVYLWDRRSKPRERRVARLPNDSASAATDLVLSGSGAIAFIRFVGGIPQVTRVDSTGTTVVDEGAGIRAGSLAVAGNRLYWTNGEGARTAPLATRP